MLICSGQCSNNDCLRESDNLCRGKRPYYGMPKYYVIWMGSV